VSDDEAKEHEERPQESQQDIHQEIKDNVVDEASSGPVIKTPLRNFNLDLDLQNKDETNTTNFTSSEQEYLY
jgi:hypothetical protein